MLLLAIQMTMSVSLLQIGFSDRLQENSLYFVPGPLLTDGRSEEESQAPVSLLLIIERKDFQCPVCRYVFQQLCDTLRLYQSGLHILCILEIDYDNLPSMLGRTEATRILEKQFRGFLKGLGVNFPFLIDEFSTFLLLEKNTPALIMMHQPFKIIKKWHLPLTGPDLRELSFFLQAKGETR